jgi:hypothetical protein
MVVMGESNAFGMCASDPRNEWVQTVGNLIRDFQDEPLVLYNNSIPANVISPRSPGYACLPAVGKPSAVERYQEDLLAPRPDLVILAYGLNDLLQTSRRWSEGRQRKQKPSSFWRAHTGTPSTTGRCGRL